MIFVDFLEHFSPQLAIKLARTYDNPSALVVDWINPISKGTIYPILGAKVVDSEIVYNIGRFFIQAKGIEPKRYSRLSVCIAILIVVIEALVLSSTINRQMLK